MHPNRVVQLSSTDAIERTAAAIARISGERKISWSQRDTLNAEHCSAISKKVRSPRSATPSVLPYFKSFYGTSLGTRSLVLLSPPSSLSLLSSSFFLCATAAFALAIAASCALFSPVIYPEFSQIITRINYSVTIKTLGLNIPYFDLKNHESEV